MARRIGAREVLRLRSVNGLSQNAIARTAHVSKHGFQDVLEADEWLLGSLDIEFRSMLLELRYDAASVVFCTLFKKKDWRPRFGGGIHADAIMNVIAHNAAWADMGEVNMRQCHG